MFTKERIVELRHSVVSQLIENHIGLEQGLHGKSVENLTDSSELIVDWILNGKTKEDAVKEEKPKESDEQVNKDEKTESSKAVDNQVVIEAIKKALGQAKATYVELDDNLKNVDKDILKKIEDFNKGVKLSQNFDDIVRIFVKK